MLPLGHIGIRAERGDPCMSLLTQDEQRTLMTLWSIARSPLMSAAICRPNDDFTLSLLSNDEVLAVNPHATKSKELFAHDNQVASVAETDGPDHQDFTLGPHASAFSKLTPAHAKDATPQAGRQTLRSILGPVSRWPVSGP